MSEKVTIHDSAEMLMIELHLETDSAEHHIRHDHVTQLFLTPVGRVTLLEVVCAPAGNRPVERYTYNMDFVHAWNRKKQPAEYTKARAAEMDAQDSKAKDECESGPDCPVHGENGIGIESLVQEAMARAGFTVIGGKEAKEILSKVLRN